MTSVRALTSQNRFMTRTKRHNVVRQTAMRNASWLMILSHFMTTSLSYAANLRTIPSASLWTPPCHFLRMLRSCAANPSRIRSALKSIKISRFMMKSLAFASLLKGLASPTSLLRRTTPALTNAITSAIWKQCVALMAAARSTLPRTEPALITVRSTGLLPT